MMPAKSNTISKPGVSSLLRKERGISVTLETALYHQCHQTFPLIATTDFLVCRNETNVQIISHKVAGRVRRESE